MGFIGKIVSHILSNMLALYAAAYLVTGFQLEGGFVPLFTTAAILTLINMFIRPVVKLLSGPFIMLTLGLFTIVVNALMLFILDKLSDPLTITGYVPLLLGTLIIGVVNLLFGFGAKTVHQKET
ncbi:MAG: phage holin family protein [Patescibacteria group bacterium]